MPDERQRPLQALMIQATLDLRYSLSFTDGRMFPRPSVSRIAFS